MNRTAQTRRSTRGFTLVELCVGVGICAALIGQAVPSLAKFRQEQRLRASAESLATDLRFARSEAARRGDSVHFRISGQGAGACYLIHTGAREDCDCATGQAVCRAPQSHVIKAEWLPASQAIRISSNAETLEFQHRQGLVTQTASIDLSLEQGPTIRQVIAITGRARKCSVGTKVGNLPMCA